MKKLITLMLIVLLVTMVAGCTVQPANPMSPEEQTTWTLVLALIAPFLIATLKQSGLSKKHNSLIALGLCLTVGIADAFYFGLTDPTNVVQTIFIVISGAFASYKMIFQPFGFDDWWTERTSIIKKPS